MIARSLPMLLIAALLLATASAFAGPKEAAAPAAEPERKAWGTLVSEDGKQQIALYDDKVVVGSATDAGARIEHQTVAPQHARIVHDHGAVYVEHLGSRLGTLLAGRELKKGQRVRIVRETLLTFGAVSWTFRFGERDTIPPTVDAPKKKDAAKGADKASGKARRDSGAK